MKHGWIVFLFTACVVRVSSPFHLPPPDPDGEPPSAGVAQPEPRSGPPPVRVVEGGPRGSRRSAVAEQDDQYKGLHESLYWNVHNEFSGGAKEEADHHDDAAARRYHSAATIADDLLGSLAQHPNPTRMYSTDSDGVMDEPTMIAKLRALRARAQQLGDAAEQRYHAALVAEFHPRTEEQRKVLVDHGRAEVLHRNGHLCWRYLEDGIRETFCWNRAGQLADHTRVDEVASEFDRIGYRAVTFGAGQCSRNDCSKDGWDTRLPDGSILRTRCHINDCIKSGWETTLPSGTTIATRCDRNDCMKDGWTTTLPDGSILRTRCHINDCIKGGWETTFPSDATITTRCDRNDCMKDGWTTRLSNGREVTCRCRYSNCLKDGADCE